MMKLRWVLLWLIGFRWMWVFPDMMKDAAFAGEVLTRVRTNKEIRCGVTEPLAGFSYKDEKGQWKGLNIDFCRAVAAAALNDPEKTAFTPLSSPNRFPALLLNRIDLLAHTTTWTFGREAGIGIRFPGVYFFAGQTFMVPAAKNIKRIEDFSGRHDASFLLSHPSVQFLGARPAFPAFSI
jgi:general L-amino acid transport system substrate-binding protein